MPTVRTAKHLLLESVECGTYDVICQFCTVKDMVVESEVLKSQSCALSKLSLPMHSNESFASVKICLQVFLKSKQFKFSRLILLSKITWERILRFNII